MIPRRPWPVATAQEQQSLELLSHALHALNAPEEQWARLGLKL